MLRKTPVLLVLALFLALPASAQLPGLTSVGVKGGASLATLRGDNDDVFEYKTGFVGGLYGQAEFIPFFTPRIEALYVQKGAAVEDVDGGYSLDYIEIPVLAKVNLPVVDQFFPSLYVGPYVSFAINREIDVEGLDDVDELPNGDELFNSTDYGLVLGADLDVPIASNVVTVSARYDLGLANVVNEDSDFLENDEAELNTGTFMLTLGVGI